MPSSPFVDQSINNTDSDILSLFTDQNVNDTNWTISSSFTGQRINQAARAIFVILGSAMIVCGVVGNGLLIAVILTRFQRKHQVHNLFLVNMAVGDILTVGYWLPYLVLDLILGYHPVVNQTHCQANGVIICTLGVVCVTSLLSISLNRYLRVCHSHLYTRTFTLPHTLLFCLLIWILGLTLALPPVLRAGAGCYRYSPSTHICSVNREDDAAYVKIIIILFSTVPLLCTGCCNLAIFRFWRKASLSSKYRFPLVVLDTKRRGQLFFCWRELLKRIRNTDPSSADPGQVQCVDQLYRQDDKVIPEIRVEECTHICHAIDSDTGVSELDYNIQDNPNESEEECSKVCLSVDNNVGVAAGMDTLTESCNFDADGPEDTSGAPKGMMRFPDKKPEDRENCHESTPCSFTVDVSLKKQMKGDEVQEVQSVDHEYQDRQEAEQTSKERDSSTSGNGLKTVDESTLMVTATELPSALRPPDQLLTPSAKQCLSPPQRPKARVSAVMDTLHRQLKARDAKKVAFVRSLFGVFLITCFSCLPHVITFVVGSYVPVPSEVVILGIMLRLTQSSISWIVYGIMIPSFRKAYLKFVRQLLGPCRCERWMEKNRQPGSSPHTAAPVSMRREDTESGLDSSCASQDPTAICSTDRSVDSCI